MTEPGDRRPPTGVPTPQPSRQGESRLRPRKLPVALLGALAVAALAAQAWALLKGILEFGAGLLGVAVVGGWAIGALLRQVRATPLLAAAMAALAWLLSLLLTWLLAMAMLPGSARTFPERVEGTPFLSWMAPQFGLLEVAGLLLYVGVAAYAARSRVTAP